MAEVRRADSAARRTAALVLVAGTCVGALLLVAFTRYRIALSDWVLADPRSSAQRVSFYFQLQFYWHHWSRWPSIFGRWVERLSGPESFRPQAFGSFVILLSSRVRGQYPEAVY